PRAAVLWELADEPYLFLGTSDADGFKISQEPPDQFTSPSDGAEAAVFIAGSKQLRATPTRIEETDALLIDRRLHERLGGTSLLSAAFSSDSIGGRLFVLDLPRVARFDFALLTLAASTLTARFEHVAAMAISRSEAVAAERVRVARDLHDGLLQQFTGVVLQIETIHDLLEKNPAEARRMLTQVEASLMTDQRELRAYVDELRPRARRKSTEFDLDGRLAELRDRFRREWKIDLDVEVGPMHPLVTQALGQETFRMISEAVMNSAKHGQASKVMVSLATREDRLWIRVTDDGIGFPFRGRHDLASMIAKQQGPSVLAERVAALNGELTVESTEEGAMLEIELPLGWRAE
ncbi:MAG TPA: histidine kinase, partial [Thermoanaerobaculia bacterium]|nr:histidine kinase [Thermoanaerobaculia bacterium]